MKRAIWAVAGVLAFAACGGRNSGASSDESSADTAASVEFSLSFDSALLPDFHGNSVRIIATRDPHKPVDGKYPCFTAVHDCFNLDKDGRLIAKEPTLDVMSTNGVLKQGSFANLCPSTDFQQGDWTFEYQVFSEPLCAGTQLNSPFHDFNFVCYDSKSIGENPNKSVEFLHPGPNYNDIVCVTKNAEKFFNFDVCIDVTKNVYPNGDATTIDPATSLPLTKLVLDCRCTPAPCDPSLLPPPTPKCECPQGQPQLDPHECAFNQACQIECLVPVTPAATP